MHRVVQAFVRLAHAAYITIMPLTIFLKRTSITIQVCVLWFLIIQILPQWSGLLCNTTSVIVCPKESRYFLYFRDLTWVDLDCTACALLHKSSPHYDSLSGILPADHQSWVTLQLEKKVALEKPCVSVTASAA